MGMLSFILKYKNVITTITAILTLFGGVKMIIDHYEQKGYNRAIVELQSETNAKVQKATEEAVKKATKDLQKALHTQKLIFDAETTRQKELVKVETVTKEIIKYVDKIKIKNECNTIDGSIIRMLNNSISNSNVTSN